MKDIRADINFVNYYVDQIDFKIRNTETVHKEDNINLTFKGNTSIDEESNTAIVSLGCIIGEDDESPLYLKVNIIGHFKYSSNCELKQIQGLITTNATAILFPYLRTTITNITSCSGIKPIILPVMNINKLIRVED